MGTSLISRTSSFVEQGGIVGESTFQLSMQVSVSDLANTKDDYNGKIPS